MREIPLAELMGGVRLEEGSEEERRRGGLRFYSLGLNVLLKFINPSAKPTSESWFDSGVDAGK